MVICLGGGFTRFWDTFLFDTQSIFINYPSSSPLRQPVSTVEFLP